MVAFSSATYKYAEGINSIYNATRNVGSSSIQTFKSMTEAARDMGSSVEEMSSALEGLQKFRRMYGPSANQYLRQFAPDITDKEGAPEALLKIAKNMSNLKKQGLDEQTFLHGMEQYVGYDTAYKLYEKPEEFTNSVEAHKNAVGTSTDKIGDKAHEDIVAFGLTMDRVNETINRQIGGELLTTLKSEIDVADKVLVSVDKAAGDFKDGIAKITEVFGKEGFSIDSLKDAFTASLPSLKDLGEQVKNAIGSMGTLGTAIAGLTAVSLLSIAASKAGSILGMIGKGKLLRLLTAGMGFELGSYIRESLGAKNVDDTVESGLQTSENIAESTTNGLAKWWNSKNSPKDVQERESTAISTFKGFGYSKADAAGILANLKKESQLNPFAVGDNGKAYGIEQWQDDGTKDSRQKKYRSYFGHTMQSVTDQAQALKEQLEFIDFERKHNEKAGWEEMHSVAEDPYQRGAMYSRRVVRPGIDEATRRREADERGRAAMDIANSPTVINIYGVTDTQGVVREVETKMKDKATFQNQANVRYQQPIAQ